MNSKSQWCFSPKADRLNTQEELMFQFKSEGREDLSQFKGSQADVSLTWGGVSFLF